MRGYQRIIRTRSHAYLFWYGIRASFACFHNVSHSDHFILIRLDVIGKNLEAQMCNMKNCGSNNIAIESVSLLLNHFFTVNLFYFSINFSLTETLT